MSRLTELREKYAPEKLDPFAFVVGTGRYNNGGPEIFRPRPEYSQRIEDYECRPLETAVVFGHHPDRVMSGTTGWYSLEEWSAHVAANRT